MSLEPESVSPKDLRSVKLLAEATEADLKALSPHLRLIRVAAKQDVIRHLDHSTNLFLVLKGQFRAKIATPSRREVPFRLIGPGGHFGEIAALAGSPRISTVSSDTEGLLAEISAQAFLDFVLARPAIGRALLASLARNVLLLNDRVFELAALQTRFRIYAELIRLAHAGRRNGEKFVIKPSPTHASLANTIGAAREAVTRELGELARAGVIATKPREIVITDMERLQKYLMKSAGPTVSQIIDWNF
jgi:CRP-like cAMP-binding protein